MRSTQQLCQPTEQGCPTSSYLPLSLFRLLSQEWCWWFPRMRAPASVYFVYFVKSISPECLVDLLNSNVVMSSADPRDERSLPEQKTGGVEGEERTTLEILKSIPCVVRWWWCRFEIGKPTHFIHLIGLSSIASSGDVMRFDPWQGEQTIR